ncbi:MAG: hypothetical protein ACTHMQ_05305 [Protaetiibacter sp.]
MAETITPLVPDTWDVRDEQRLPQTLQTTTVVIAHQEFEPLEAAPLGTLWNLVTVTVATPYTDESMGEDDVDDSVVDLAGAVMFNPSIRFERAEKVLADGTYFAWSLTLHVISSVTPAPEPEPLPEEE